MIINKPIKQVKGYIQYHYDFDRRKHWVGPDTTDEERESFFDSRTFASLEEFLQLLGQETLDSIKEEYDADKVWISDIILSGKSEDGETSAQIELSKKRTAGVVTTKINNEDVENRLMLNLKEVKTIIDNTLEQYPVRY